MKGSIEFRGAFKGDIMGSFPKGFLQGYSGLGFGVQRFYIPSRLLHWLVLLGSTGFYKGLIRFYKVAPSDEVKGLRGPSSTKKKAPGSRFIGWVHQQQRCGVWAFK